jgi:hypothetical protein
LNYKIFSFDGGDTTLVGGIITACYWLNLSQAGLNPASIGIGVGYQYSPPDDESEPDIHTFDEQWPSDDPATSWGDGGTGVNGNYWQDLGRWVTGDFGRRSAFPRLYWEPVN